MGQGGVPGRVNQRLMKRYGSILLGTILGGSTAAIFGAEEEAVQSGSNGQQSTARNNGAIITDIVRRDIEQITQDLVQRNQAVQPIITVPAGKRITVIPTDRTNIVAGKSGSVRGGLGGSGNNKKKKKKRK